MKILLVAINAKYIHSNLAVYSLKAYAEQYVLSAEALPCPVEIELGEYTINHSCPKILGDIFEKKPDVVGFSCYIWNMEYVRQLLFVRKNLWKSFLIWKG